jgi:GWxTD domain-containing protein
MRRTFLTLGLAALLCGSMSVTSHARTAAPDAFAQSGPKQVYEKWLSEDVIYIITPEEKRAFLLLKTDDEREQFIEAFWQRRDTSPDTQENEYRVEYYGRIAYANQNFTSGVVAGWQSDRGRIYITYGKPELIEKTTSGQVWIYKHLPGSGRDIKFEFSDATGTGDLRLRQ